MSEAKGQQEPSMEEILASIRRIIAEDGESAAAPAPAPVLRPAAPAEQPQVAREEEILELTESVAEDGTVVSLAPGGAMKPPGTRAEPSSAAPEGAEEPPESTPAAEELPEPMPDPPPLRLRSAATVIKRAEPSAPEPPRAAPAQAAAPRAEAPPAPEPPSRPAQAAAPPPEPAAQPPPPPMVGDRLVSIATAAASVAALSQLADLSQKGQVGTTPLGEAGRTLESLVRELLKPMLRDWMDANLAPLVERLVREEIQRMAREARGR